ncbi:MAG: Hydroxymethylglutaryl-CoA lyase [Labilithrix sp.]|nr:Hydroxymethylglutaryl-CoA lyase [Labilithrix sp.]
MSTVRIVEVAARDGLQNEKSEVSTETKVELIDRLALAGLKEIEATSFVSPRWVPQMADHDAVMRGLVHRPGVRYPVLVPNLRGYQNAVAAGAREVAVFASATESFSRKNINCSIDESFERFAPVFEAARADGVAVRGYVSCVVGCPYEGYVPPERAADVARRLYELGCFEISLGDTIGVGTPATVRRMIEKVAEHVPMAKVAGHFHDTYGMAAANAYASYELGVRTFDSSVGGLGGCPYAKGATGNVATEDLVYLFHGIGVDTGVDLDALVDIARWISDKLGRAVQSRVSRALLAKRADAPSC